MHPAEGQVARLPDLDAEIVGGKDRAADMVGADEVDLPINDAYSIPSKFLAPGESRIISSPIL